MTQKMIESKGSLGLLPGEPESQDIRILADRTSIEVFANRGSLTMAFCLIGKDNARSVTVTAEKGTAIFEAITVHEVSSIWDVNTNAKNPECKVREQ